MDNQSRENIRLALRVLTTFSEKGDCNPDDVNALRFAAGELDWSGAPLDELACMVIHRRYSTRTREPA